MSEPAPEPGAPYPPMDLSVTLELKDLHLIHEGVVMTEAHYSANVIVESKNGFQWQVTVRRGPEGHIESTMATVEERLLEKGYKPQTRQPAPQPTPDIPPTQEAREGGTAAEDSGDTKPCPVHAGFKLKKQTNDKGTWWSHKTDEGWCHGKSRSS